jgi:hypothetical protein
MRIRIDLEGGILGDITITEELPFESATIEGTKELLASMLDEAVAKLRRAYELEEQ